jgi:uncharacterized surface protein with fasciclin (FAS1) repeats
MTNIFETVRADRSNNKFLQGIESVTGLLETLSGPGPFTVFMPTDIAFNSLTNEEQTDLFGDPEKLTRVITYHIMPGYYTVDDLLDYLFLKTMEGQRIRVWSRMWEALLVEEAIDPTDKALSYISTGAVNASIQESMTINGGHVLQANVMADNGILHIIDKVLVPPFTKL